MVFLAEVLASTIIRSSVMSVAIVDRAHSIAITTR